MSRLAEMQARFQQKQMQEKEEKLLRLYENQQQRAFDKVSRGSSGSSDGSSPVGVTNTGPGRVRQMFDERRQKAGIDRSYPLEPLKQTTRLNGHVTSTREHTSTTTKSPGTRQTMRTSVQKSMSQTYAGGKPKTRTTKHTTNAAYSNGNFIEQTSRYEESDDLENDHPLQMMQQQQKQLERMMNNHNLDENIEDEELIDVGIDELDESRDNSPGPEDNWAKKQNGYEENTPTTKMPLMKPSPMVAVAAKLPAKKVLPKSNSTAKTISPRSQKVPVSKPIVSSMSSKQPPNSGRTTISTSQKTTRTNQSAVVKDNLKPCKYCDRRFAEDRLAKHEEICAKTLKKKRKTYDATKHRVQGTEAEVYIRKGVSSKGPSVKSKPSQATKSNWRRQHEEFIGAIRAAKMAQAHVAAGGKLTDLPPPPPSLNPDYIQCPHCGRRFNAAAAERHIPKCATMMHNKPNRLGPPPKR